MSTFLDDEAALLGEDGEEEPVQEEIVEAKKVVVKEVGKAPVRSNSVIIRGARASSSS
jgi:hypothetical protein